MAFHHAPPDYDCPFCRIARGEPLEAPYTQPSDVVLRTADVTAFIGARFWPNNPGHVIVIPNRHVENVYELVPPLLTHVHVAAREIALALKRAYQCSGTSTRQHNEPDGDQEVWHYHLHVFPRYADDRLYELTAQGRWTTTDERREYAERVRRGLGA